jgi:flagellar biosynthesis protein FliR
LLLDGWVPVVEAFASSFAHVPAGATADRAGWLRFGLALPATLLHAALLVAAPVIAVAATLHLALAAVTRVVPRFSSLTVTFPIVFAAALAVTVAVLPALVRAGGAPWLVTPWAAMR